MLNHKRIELQHNKKSHGVLNRMCPFFFFVGESSEFTSGFSTRTRFSDGGVLGRAGILNMMEPGGG